MPSLDHSSGVPGPTDVPSPAERPLVSLEGWARFEARARNRRIERRLEAARAAIQTRRFADARAAVAELREIDSSLQVLPELAAQLALAERPSAKPLVIGPYVAAAASFAALTLASSWLGDEELQPLVLRSSPTTQIIVAMPVAETSLPSSAADVPLDDLLLDGPAPTAGGIREPIEAVAAAAPVLTAPEEVAPRRQAAVPPPAVPQELPAAVPQELPAAVPQELQPPPGAIVERTGAPPPSPPVEAPSAPTFAAVPPASPPSAAVAPAPSRAAAPAPIVGADETSLVREALKRYQTAYDRLDAELAHAIWPSVNQAALARAFGDLESQSITFNDCDVRPGADTASAVCTGSARYTPRVGSRESRVEPRVWNFTLRKRAGGWLIETVRAER